MFNQLKSYFDIGTNLYGLEIFHEENTLIYHIIHVKKTKQELLIVADKRFTNWEELQQFIDKKIPLCLTINSSEILNKLEPKEKNENHISLIEHSFPSLDFERFYFNATSFKNFSYLAIMEKKKVNVILEKFKNNGISILSFHLGLSSLSSLLPYINEETINTTTGELHFNNETALLTKTSNHRTNLFYSINGLKIDSNYLVSFGNILQQLAATSIMHTNYEASENKLKNEFKYTRYFQISLWPIITFFLALLLINFFVFNHFYEQQQAVELNLNSITTNKEKLLELKENVLLKEKRVEAILANTNSKSTLFLDIIGQTLPNTIRLDRINYQPLAKPIQSAKEIELNFKEILISGETNNNDDISNWISVLEKLNWVDQVETLAYEYKNNRSSFFSLKITINEQ